MAYTRPTTITFLRATKVCLLLLFAPKQFLVHLADDNHLLNPLNEGAGNEPGAFVVRRAFLTSFLLVAASGTTGYLAGLLVSTTCTCATPKIVMWLQIVGACLLLWGTLFVRGWEIQTYSGHTLTERVNQWLYRALYCVGTAIVVFSLAWPACPVCRANPLLKEILRHICHLKKIVSPQFLF